VSEADEKQTLHRYLRNAKELPLDARGTVPWWPEDRRHPTLHTLLVHTIQETARHAGHADIIRETIDGAAGLREGVSNMPPEAGAADWKQHYDKLEGIARAAHPALSRAGPAALAQPRASVVLSGAVTSGCTPPHFTAPGGGVSLDR